MQILYNLFSGDHNHIYNSDLCDYKFSNKKVRKLFLGTV